MKFVVLNTICTNEYRFHQINMQLFIYINVVLTVTFQHDSTLSDQVEYFELAFSNRKHSFQVDLNIHIQNMCARNYLPKNVNTIRISSIITTSYLIFINLQCQSCHLRITCVVVLEIYNTCLHFFSRNYSRYIYLSTFSRFKSTIRKVISIYRQKWILFGIFGNKF